jgi:hypothetical protein
MLLINLTLQQRLRDECARQFAAELLDEVVMETAVAFAAQLVESGARRRRVAASICDQLCQDSVDEFVQSTARGQCIAASVAKSLTTGLVDELIEELAGETLRDWRPPVEPVVSHQSNTPKFH